MASLFLQKGSETLRAFKLLEASITLIWKALWIEILKLLWLKIVGETTINKRGLIKTFNLKFETHLLQNQCPGRYGQHVGLLSLAVVLTVLKDSRAFSARGRPMNPFAERECSSFERCALCPIAHAFSLLSS